jgi:hypothetical protein
MRESSNKYLITALLLGLAFHGSSMFFTLESTYDALIHVFFGDHYANNWFETWSYKWYTGFTVLGYPPLVHQAIGLLSYLGGLKFGLFSVAFIAILLWVTGVYRFSLLMTSSRKVAGYAAILSVFSSSFVETLHIFGQLPSIIGISILMHALPEIYLYIKTGKKIKLLSSLSLMAVTVTSHHVTPIFGMVFFIFPLIGMVIMDEASEQTGSLSSVKFKLFLKTFIKKLKRTIIFGISSLVVIILCILPYWLNTKNNPITQVPIPHGSRDDFLEVTSSGLVFFLIPWGFLLILLPYIFYRYYSKRYLFFGISITFLFVLGTGGTTPIPKLLLGENAFNILTLDRFTLWASIMSLPIFGEFIYRFVEGDLKYLIQQKYGAVYHRLISGFLVLLFLFMTVFTITLGYFRPTQPQKIDMLPVVNFLNQDQHHKWRFLTLGFGDQMAWLSAKTQALTVDGNYHSARKLPELTTRPVERLENSKFQGIAGIGSLQQFLTTPDKYNLKYIFSNDKFYDPLLYFCGWQRLPRLENGIRVWERLNVPPLPSTLPKGIKPIWMRVLWGSVPLLTVLLAFLINIQPLFVNGLKIRPLAKPAFFNFQRNYTSFNSNLLTSLNLWSLLIFTLIIYGTYLFYFKNNAHHSPKNVVVSYYDAIDFKEFEKAYSLIDPESNKSLDQYMLEISVTDGLLSSYAKLDEIQTEVVNYSDTTATIKVDTYWISPLDKIHETFFRAVNKVDNKWYLVPEKLNNDLPPDQLLISNENEYHNQGRRKVTTDQTDHQDVLKQPVLEVISASLVKYDDRYAIVGQIQNLDNVPADVFIKAALYGINNEQLARHNAKYHLKHKLLPKEVTPFRVDFEGIAWSRTEDSIPRTFDPDEFTPAEFEHPPSKFSLQVAGNVSTKDLYKGLSISKIELENHRSISGTVFNSGLQQVTVPQLLVSYFNEDKKLIWVAQKFLKQGVRQQRKGDFRYSIDSPDSLRIINSSLENVSINGSPNAFLSEKLLPKRDRALQKELMQPIEHPSFSYFRIRTNTFIGNPK